MKPLKADLLLVLVTLCWGSSYLFMKIGLGSMGEFNLIALRFGIAWRTVKYAALLGFLLFGVFACITFGLSSTTTSNAGFLVSMTVIFVPLLSVVVLRKKIETRLIIGVVLTLIGIGFLTISVPFGIQLGDGLCILAALIYSMYILVTSYASKVTDALTLGILQLGFTSVYGLFLSLLFETPHMPDTTEAWVAILALSILCSGLGFILMPIAQQYTTPTHTGLIFALEPVFAVFFGMMFAGEIIPLKGYVGAVFMLLGILAAEVKRQRT